MSTPRAHILISNNIIHQERELGILGEMIDSRGAAGKRRVLSRYLAVSARKEALKEQLDDCFVRYVNV